MRGPYNHSFVHEDLKRTGDAGRRGGVRGEGGGAYERF